MSEALPPQPDALLTVKEASRRLKVSPSAILRHDAKLIEDAEQSCPHDVGSRQSFSTVAG